MNEDHVPILPRITPNAVPSFDARPREATPVAAAVATTAKTFMSFSNEYWLIGIIIVLVTVVLMLIVYIVKIKQNATPAINNQSVPETSRRATIMEAATRTHELADKPFVAHSRAPKVVIEAVSEPEPEQEQEERAPEPEKEAPIFTMQSGPEPQIEEIPAPVPQPEPPQVAPARRRGGRTPK